MGDGKNPCNDELSVPAGTSGVGAAEKAFGTYDDPDMHDEGMTDGGQEPNKKSPFGNLSSGK